MESLPLKDLLELIPEYLTVIAIYVGGIWAYLKFVRRRESEPATNLDLDVLFAGCQDEKWLIEVTAVLENKSLVRQTYKDFRLRIRYLLPGDKVIDGDDERLHQQLIFPHTTTVLKDQDGKKVERFFVGEADRDKRENYINPNQIFLQRYITSIPVNATFIWVKADFIFDQRSSEDVRTSSQRLFKVPACTEVNFMSRYKSSGID